jgi:PAS domain S-box-containing protein
MDPRPTTGRRRGDSTAGKGGLRGAEQRLADSEASRQQIASILERVSDAFVALDTDWRYTYVNEKAAQIFGRRRDDLIGKHVWTEFPEGVGQPFYHAYYRAVATQEPVHLEEYYSPYGRWFENRIYPSADGLSIFFQDITERKRAEALRTGGSAVLEMVASGTPLGESLDRLLRVIEAQSEGVLCSILLLDEDGRHVRHGAAPSLPKPYLEFIDGAAIGPRAGSCGTAMYRREPVIVTDILRDPLWAEYRDVAASYGLRACWSTPLCSHDGTVLGSFAMYYRAVRGPAPEEVRIIDAATHIACIAIERRRAQEAIEASERRLSLIFDTVGDVLFLLSVEPGDVYRFASVNRKFLEVTGLRPEQVVGKRVEEVLPETAHALVLTKYREAIRENRTVQWEEVSHYPAGTLYGQVVVAPARDASGNCTHLIGSVHDITEIRRAEEEIRTLNQELEQRVHERTAQLQAANKDLETFSYSVSHDLRAPLRAVSGFAEIIARRHRAALNEEGRHYVDNIVQASERMGHLIDDLLSYSRLGRQAVRRAPVPLREILDPLARDLAGRLREIGGTLEIAEDLPTVTGDRTSLTQIFTNLLENAMTYRLAAAPSRVAVDSKADGDRVVVRVSDNGIGIPREHQEKIFNIFQRLHGEDEYPGTGIGLATVKKCAELLGGRVWVESVVGEGSIFFVELPGR